MNATIDELRVDEDGTIYVGVVPPEDSGAGDANVLAAISPGTPSAFAITALLKKIATDLGEAEPVLAIVHGGGNRFTLITGHSHFSEIDGGLIVDRIREIACLVLATRPQKQLNRAP